MERFLKILIFITGFICLIAFFIIRSNEGLNLLFHPSFETRGDLYTQVSISHFDEELPPLIGKRNENGQYDTYRSSKEHPEINDADIITVGDSYFFYPRFTTFPHQLSRKTDYKVFFDSDYNVYKILLSNGYKKKENAIPLIYEIGERGIHLMLSNPLNKNPELNNGKVTNYPIRILSPGMAEKRYTRLLQKSIFTHRIYKWINTKKFDWFGYIDKQTPVYSLDPPVLFYETTVNNKPGSIQYQYSDKELRQIADNLKAISVDLKETYNIDFVFLPVPSKISIYYPLTDVREYNNFLPKLYKELEKRDIKYVDLYHTYKESKEILFYGTDTHWNEAGADLAVDVLIKKYFNNLEDEVVLEKER